MHEGVNVNVHASVEIDVAQGDDRDQLIIDSLVRGMGPEDLMHTRIERTDKVSGNGHPVWRIEGHPAQVLRVLLNWNGFQAHQVVGLMEDVERIEYRVDAYDPEFADRLANRN